MKAIVLYYSATGNTAKIAGSIHRGMRSVLERCDLESIREADPGSMADYDLLVIGGPIWYFRETANLRDFIYNMPDMKGKQCALFCTHGSSPDGYMFSLSTAVKRKGMTIIGWNNWYGSVYQVLHMPKPYMTDGHPDEISLEQAGAFGSEMAERAMKIGQGETGLIPKPGIDPGSSIGVGAEGLWKLYGLGDSAPPPEPGVPPPKFKMEKAVRELDPEKCKYPDCRKCIGICPISAISFIDGGMSIKESCIDCALCDKLCPEGAIDVNDEALLRRTRHIINTDKCKYPECTLCADYCPMACIDLAQSPPVFGRSCEGDDLCWMICPEGAIEITNLDTTHASMAPMCRFDLENHPFVKKLEVAEEKGAFRRYVSLNEVGIDNIVYKNENAPRFVIEHE